MGKKKSSPWRTAGVGLLLAALALACEATIAYMFSASETTRNQFEMGQVCCQVTERVDGNVKQSIQVQNTGSLPAYLRVRLVSCWADSAGKTLGKTAAAPAITPGAGWVPLGDDTYCWSQPVQPGAGTGNLLGGDLTLQLDGGSRQVVEVFADAIQAEPRRAVEENWKVSLSADGAVTGPIA